MYDYKTKTDRAIEKQLARLGLGGLTVTHERTVLRSNGVNADQEVQRRADQEVQRSGSG